MKSSMIGPFSVLLAAAISVACAHGDHSEDKHEHGAFLRLAAYSEKEELFAEATPFTAGTESIIRAHLTRLEDFKPLEEQGVTATLEVGSTSVSQTAGHPEEPGVFTFSLTPTEEGEGRLTFATESGSLIALSGIRVYKDHHEATKAAEAEEKRLENYAIFPKEMSWKIDFATEECRTEPFGAVIRTMARIQSAPGDGRAIVAKSDGIVTFADGSMAEGCPVRTGETLFFIRGEGLAENNPDIRFHEAENNFNLARQEYERKQRLAADNIIAEAELARAKRDLDNAKAVFENLGLGYSSGRQALAAPVSGHVTRLLIRNGEYAEAGSTLAYVSGNRTLLITASVPPRYFESLSRIVSATFRTMDGERIRSLDELGGRMVSYGKSLSEDSPLIPVVFQANNPGDLLPGGFVELFIRTRNAVENVTVPCEALLEEMGRHFIYVQADPERFEKREVTTGATDGIRKEILSGLAAGERIITKGAVFVKLAQATGKLDAHSGHVH